MTVIQIHRQRPVVDVGERTVRLTREEHSLLTAFGMMDNRLMSHALLVEEAGCDVNSLRQRVYCLRKKIGDANLKLCFGKGYILEGDVRFVE